jgi:hypothetical protein
VDWIHLTQDTVTWLSDYRRGFDSVADRSSGKHLHPWSFLGRVINSFGTVRIYLREYCVWNLSGRSVGHGIAQIRTMKTAAAANSSIRIWYTRDPFIQFTGTRWINMTPFQSAHCNVHFLLTAIPYHIRFNFTKSTGASGGARGSVVGWGTMLQTGRSRVRVPMRWIFFQLT